MLDCSTEDCDETEVGRQDKERGEQTEGAEDAHDALAQPSSAEEEGLGFSKPENRPGEVSIAEGDGNQKQDACDGDQNGEGCGALPAADEEGERHLRDAKTD